MADAVIVKCPKCGAKLRLGDAGALGKKIRCPECEHGFVAAAKPASKSKQPVPEEPEEEDHDEDEEEAPPAKPKFKGRAAEPAPEKKKKKKRRPKPEKSGPPVALILLLAIGGVTLIGGGIAVAVVVARGSSGGGAAAAKPGTPPKMVEHRGKAFSCKIPEGWKAEEEGAESRKYLTVTGGGAKIRVQYNDKINMDAGPEAGVAPDDSDRSPLGSVFLDPSRIESFKEERGTYSEGESEKFSCKLGLGRRAPFTDKGTFSSLKGYRVIILNSTKGIDMYCQCPAAEFDTLAPAFKECMESLGSGVRQ